MENLFTYSGGHLSAKELRQFDDQLTFSDAKGYSREDSDRIIKHVQGCNQCAERRHAVLMAALAEK